EAGAAPGAGLRAARLRARPARTGRLVPAGTDHDAQRLDLDLVGVRGVAIDLVPSGAERLAKRPAGLELHAERRLLAEEPQSREPPREAHLGALLGPGLDPLARLALERAEEIRQPRLDGGERLEHLALGEALDR